MLLCDPDRTAQYRSAITAAIAEFRRQNDDRAPVVLDLGCGSGLLGLLALHAGAAKVVSVDMNEECVKMTQETIEASGATAERWVAVHADDLDNDIEERKQYEIEIYDMLVSEMLGTWSFGEQCFDIISKYTLRLRSDVVGGPYVIPRHVIQTVGLYTLNDGAAAATASTSWLVDALTDVLRRQSTWIGTNSLNLHPACLDLKCAEPPQTVYEADYVGLNEDTMAATFRVPDADSNELNLLLCEWTATLWGDVHLENTLRTYRESMPLPNAIGRECAWGFAIAAPPPGDIVVGVCKNEYHGYVMEAMSIHGEDGEEMGEETEGERAWSVRDIQVLTDVSMGALLARSYPAACEAALDRVGAGRDVLVETSENGAVLRCIDRACAARKLAEPWHQDDIGTSWTMCNSILRTGQAIDEPAEDGNLELAIFPDVSGECVTEAVCRYNDERFGPEKTTAEQALEMIQSFGGDVATRTVPSSMPAAAEFTEVELLVEGDVALATCISAPLRRLQGYAALTRHGMMCNVCMPGIFTQALPLMVRPVSRKRKKDNRTTCIPLRMASTRLWPHETRSVAQIEVEGGVMNGKESVRELVSALCTGGAAVVMSPKISTFSQKM